jgi:hypothetical protein
MNETLMKILMMTVVAGDQNIFSAVDSPLQSAGAYSAGSP